MQKYDLTDCSIVIPVQIDCSQRWEHLHYQIAYFSRFFLHYELIIVEHGKQRKIQIPDQKAVRIEFVESEEEFSTSKICNSGAALVKTPFFCKCDTDVAIQPEAIFDAFQLLKTNPGISLALPYNGVSFTIQDPLREEVMSSFNLTGIPAVRPQESSDFAAPHIALKSNDSMGLIHHFRTSVFKKLGGYNEEFVGWGYEDNEILTRFKSLGHPKVLLERYNAFHLEHPRTDGSPFHLLKNMFTLNSVESMSPDQLKEYIQTWSRFS